MLFNWANVLIFVVAAVGFVGFALFVAYLIRPTRNVTDKYKSYECGELPVMGPWVRFNIRFYVVALVFIIFDVEIVFLYPWATVFKDLGLLAYAEMGIFLAILILGLAYIWRKGDLEWIKPEEERAIHGSARSEN